MSDSTALVIEGTARAVAPAFDYAELSADAAVHAKAAAGRIQRQNRKMADAIVSNGLDLLAIKGMLAHGQFQKWLAAECRMSERTARYYMATARTFEGKTAIIADLTPSTIFALTSAETVRSTVIEKREAGEPLDERAISNMLWEERQERKMAEVQAKLTPEQRRRIKARDERYRREREEGQKKREAEQQRRQTATTEAAALIVEKMPDDVTRLLALLDLTWNAGELVSAIKAAAK